ncbi:MAG: class I SAM-dependent methyltransferase [Candidatus Sericytochromatia bacterium]|nr:class I SAM-dependent methyltransferase [Candidatus Sericytochromatia bacterium]
MSAPEPAGRWARRLTPRLEAVLGLVPPCAHLVDVGTDHALVPLAAVQRGLAQRATGVDRRPAPLEAARRTLGAAGEGRVALMLGEGLAGLSDVEVLVIAGLGAATMLQVLATVDRRVTRHVVLAPLTEPARLRRWAREAGWHLAGEALVAEGRRWFLALRLEPGAGPDPAYDVPGWEVEALEALGPWLLRRGGPAYGAWLAAEQGRLGALPPASGSSQARRLAWLGRAVEAGAGQAGMVPPCATAPTPVSEEG